MFRCFECFREINNDAKICPYCGTNLDVDEVTKWTLSPGTILNGKYQIGRMLGEGGFGITYLAWDINMQTKVAVKEYYPEGLASRDITSVYGNTVMTLRGNASENYQEGMKRYVREAAVLSKFFDLPGIVTVKDFFYENATAYIVMEYIDGISLKEYLKENGGKLKYDEVLNLLKPVMQSLAVVHKKNLLHRDISPDNIMLDKSGNVKLIDFGAARQFGVDADRSMTVVLKHGYAPMEQYSSRGNHGAWTDVYALCAVVYRCITGAAPIESIDRLSQDNYIPLEKACKKVPKYIATAVNKGLAVNPRDRYQTINELYDDLYISFKGRVSRIIDKIYKVVRKLLILLIVFLLVGVVAGIFIKKNSDNFVGIQSRFAEVMGLHDNASVTESADEPERATEKKEQERKNTVENKEQESGTDEKESEVNHSATVQEVSYNQSVKEKTEAQDTFVQDESTTNINVSKGIEIASQGVLNGYSQDLTVGDILDLYADYPGKWMGYEDDKGQVYVYYQGYKNGESFAIEFETYSDDTFRVTGASKNGEQLDAYSDFFQSILDEVWG